MVGLGALITLVDSANLKTFLRGDLFLFVLAHVFLHLSGESEIAFVRAFAYSKASLAMPSRPTSAFVAMVAGTSPTRMQRRERCFSRARPHFAWMAGALW